MGAISSWGGEVRLGLGGDRRQIGNRVHGEGEMLERKSGKGFDDMFDG